jgi:hypothetical protein
MSTWAPDTLGRFGAADDLHVSPFRADGVTPGTPTWIWSVVVDGDLYARAWNGRRSSWFRAAVEQAAGSIQIAGEQHDVTFDEPGPDLNSRIDAAYEQKYAGSSYLPPMLQDGPTAATVRIRPRTA